MTKIKVESKSAQAVITLVVLTIVLLWAVRGAQSIHRLLRLCTGGTRTDAELVYASTRFITTWPYRLEYRFQVDDQVYEEPDYRGYRTRDIGAPVPKAAWKEAQAAEVVPILYLAEDPSINMPADWGNWLPVYVFDRVWGLLLSAAIFLLVLIGVAEVLTDDHIEFDEGLLKPLGGLVVVIIPGWVLLTAILRVAHLVIGVGDMDVLDLIMGLLTTAAWVAVPVGILVAIARKG